MRIILGFVVGYLIFHFVDFRGPRQMACKNKQDFDAKYVDMLYDLAMIDANGNHINRSELSAMFNNDRRISGLKSAYATARDFQIGCDAMDDIVQRFSNK